MLGHKLYQLPDLVSDCAMNVRPKKCDTALRTWHSWSVHVVFVWLSRAFVITYFSVSCARNTIRSSPDHLYYPEILGLSQALFGICALLSTPFGFPTVVWTGVTGSYNWIKVNMTLMFSAVVVLIIAVATWVARCIRLWLYYKAYGVAAIVMVGLQRKNPQRESSQRRCIMMESQV